MDYLFSPLNSHMQTRFLTPASADMRRWLLSQETSLLRYRYLSSNKQDKDDFFHYYKDDFNMESIRIPLPDQSCWDDKKDAVHKKVILISH